MMNNYEQCLALVLKSEGGFVNDARDPGGATNHGITIGTLSDYWGRPATVAEVKALDLDTVGRIYRVNYWDKLSCDVLPLGVDYAAFDFAVNSGPARAIIGLQRAIGVADDGRLGPITRGKARTANPDHTITGICEDRLAMLRKLSTWRVYGKGWTHRVASVQMAAHRMVPQAKDPQA